MRVLSIAAAVVLCATSASAQPRQTPATLAGHALLPAATTVEAPADAPDDLRIAGKFTDSTGRRIDAIGSIAGNSFLSAPGTPRATGFSLPIRGQSVQGMSGIKSNGDGTFWVLTDNGFGSRANSSDSILMAHRIRPDWATGAVAQLETVFLHDPDKKVPFRLTHEATAKRYLTGADFDVESIQPVADGLWFADEFGPYLIKTDRAGKVLAVYETSVDGKPARSPDHYAVSTPPTPTSPVNFTVRRSRGYEGMAASKDGRFLYPLLEGPLWNAEAKDWEKVDGKEALRVLEFDLVENKWTGRFWFYVLEENGNNIGDFNMIDAQTGLIIERDNGEGVASRACPAGQNRPDCFNAAAKFKRIYKIELGEPGKPVRKIAYIDLLDIADPRSVARQGGADGRFTFPFVTIEDVDIIDGERIIVANDNNFPYSAGREPQKQDDNEFILLEARDLLQAR